MTKMRLGFGIASAILIPIAIILFVIPQPYECAKFFGGCWYIWHPLAIGVAGFGGVCLIILLKIRKMTKEQFERKIEEAKRKHPKRYKL